VPEELKRVCASPLALVNACSSGEQTPLSFGGLAPYLLDLGARAVIGTAVETPIRLAAALGPDLIGRMLRDGQSAGAALRAARGHFLEQRRNPLGLLYELYGNAALHVADDHCM
ncbi:MAG: CHAT domain-containing protein, partial [Chloroflexales bacterium]